MFTIEAGKVPRLRPWVNRLQESPFVAFAMGNAFLGPAARVCLGIDPGLNRTGYAVLKRGARGPQLVEGGVIRSSPRLPLAERVQEIAQGIREVLQDYAPQGVAIEQVFSMVRNPKTAILMAHARGAILCACADLRLPVVHYSPRQVKRLLTGSGTASKEQVQRAVQREFGLNQPLEPNDVADACAIALCHHYSLRLPQPALAE